MPSPAAVTTYASSGPANRPVYGVTSTRLGVAGGTGRAGRTTPVNSSTTAGISASKSCDDLLPFARTAIARSWSGTIRSDD